MFFTVSSHDFLKVYYGSKVSAEPDLLQGDAAAHVFTAGHYKASGKDLELTDVPTRSVTVQPRRPFAVSSKLWSEYQSAFVCLCAFARFYARAFVCKICASVHVFSRGGGRMGIAILAYCRLMIYVYSV